MENSKNDAWRCTVCGYIHRGPEPPDECPVCGAPKKNFEPYTEVTEQQPEEASRIFRCLVCNHEHKGDSPPKNCPVCGAPDKRFEAISGPNGEVTAEGEAEEILVVGGGIASISAIEAIRAASSRSKITLLSKETHIPYYRLNLTRFLAGEITEENLPIHPEKWYEEQGITLVNDAEVNSISLAEQEISLLNGNTYSFDKLILTAGGHSFIPPVSGVHREGVTALRTFDDVRNIRKAAENAHVVVVGGGILGLETAGAIVSYSKKVTLLEGFKWLMPRQLTQKAARLLENYIKGLGIHLKTNVMLKEIAGDERVAGVELKDGETISADLVIITTGVRSNSYLARVTGLQVNQGIIVNDYMQTSHSKIYAAGDIAEHRGIVYGLWNAAQYQGKIAGMNAAGSHVEFGGIPRSNSIKVLGVDLFSIGKFEPEDGSYTVVEESTDEAYFRFVFRDAHLVGSILYGDTSISASVKKAIEQNKDFSGVLKVGVEVNDIWRYLENR